MTPRIVVDSGSDRLGSCFIDPLGRFSVRAADRARLPRLLRMNPYQASMAFVNGEMIIDGDLFSAIRFFRDRAHLRISQWFYGLMAKVEQAVTCRLRGKRRAAPNIRFHYDRSDAFYRLFLDSKLLYSAAYFEDEDTTLEDAQTEKLDRICRKVDLRPGERLLDIGCGWGALVNHAAERFGARAVGCTLSRNQFTTASTLIKEHGLDGRVSILERDYRDLEGRFDKITSVGMFEHVGRCNLAQYFRKLHSLLADDGLLLNRGVVRPEGTAVDGETLFLQKTVFPGGELLYLAEVIREAERAGFKTLEVEDFRQHYALTCRAWVSRLQQNQEECSSLVGSATFRTWLLYLAASAVSFEDDYSGAAQLIFAKRRIPNVRGPLKS